ncbi:GHMP family kinase ATP-binding protein [Tessaracoccus coleopterorum]|uniref:GHMP family kinase ATP-binding protein n=1 Tax=Tessaracoccus coleopterorum TaxID=2714950 RepID=UPI001E4E5118|nr:hypothetical protein [Tessaracoccus coleopterorum]
MGAARGRPPGRRCDAGADIRRAPRAGLSSSAAIECATVAALSGLYGLDIAPMDRAKLARVAENAYVGAPPGCSTRRPAPCARRTRASSSTAARSRRSRCPSPRRAGARGPRPRHPHPAQPCGRRVRRPARLL